MENRRGFLGVCTYKRCGESVLACRYFAVADFLWKGRVWTMRLTMEQRIAALERDNVVLHDTIDLLHRLLKEHRQLINDYVTQQMSASDRSVEEAGDVRPEDALYTFVCRQRFDRMSKEVESLRKLIANPRFGSKAG